MAEMKVQSLERTFNILELLAHEPEGLSLASISAAVDLPRSTTFRLLSVLLQREYARKTRDPGVYRLGPAFIGMGSRYLNSLELTAESAPFMNELAASLGMIVFLGRRQGARMVYIDKQDTYSSLRKYSIIGQQKPLYCTSLGKALLMDMEDDDVRALLADERFESFGPNTVKNVDELLADLERCRGRGWTRDDQEAEAGMNCVAAPIRDYRGRIIASISASWMLDARPDLEAGAAAVKVTAAARSISHVLGCPESTR